ncbi:tRNA nucleotidyltransferase [Thermococcus kodakarensis KOD1]|uniref:CCA-adding enzyme n=1 Tax=Thermococcus kodakarensis (strain ATCC BAA-918 / JCM 12380 / KOD1) TaxID=69014 RepID=CCA_THEKO|nr:CCA tRNA nucleotidyltransferase [Thermococcus kodakarensis]Q5JJ38.1 RecName: Full=CCA-adding enzyme; AltName: Full=CCA tRNA nucleotidyltransferase; AltName: Full=tRNA CCA-pyrophosphorylase; AltName: Full=tRNA adenylyl-/cytidylyl- transferase; AltName: Full=tRNA nucleotidyltransferase; AltName: Full=tRNA-NT [Thermococcus kodakarensis KOD1]WCN27656.1 CCA tRNA nucleotidyltransferase [Thermococcus kodakarensis]WCN29947.1 CCA tRNA nucleotidyltransferase [Thermococcus kodakarensis]BAD85930.1 tRNA 
MEMEEVIAEVLQKIVPTEEERAFVKELIGELEGIAREKAQELGLEVKPYFVGSLAKDTYLAGDHDVDLFLAFPLDTPLEEVRERGLELGKEIGKTLGEYEIAYAEHPYVRAKYRDVKVDLVPCYDVRDWKDVRTAVDRSILHTKWVNENLNGKNNEVRLLKRFLKGIKAYGSEIYVRGFSGYLSEILVIKYGSFVEVLEKADFILRQKVVDPAGWLKREPEIAMKTVRREVEEDKPLVVIDPVDPRRNVAANLSWEKYGRFYFKADEFLQRPSLEFFFPTGKTGGDYLAELRRKGTHLITLLFDVPEMVDDLLFPQLERSARGFEKALSREGFEVLGWNTGRYGAEKAFVMLELDRVERPRVKIHPGPEFFTERGRDFYRKNERVWLVGKRLYAEKRVKENIIDVVRELLEKNQVALGKNLRETVKGAEILVDYVPRPLENEAYLFLSREKEGLKH